MDPQVRRWVVPFAAVAAVVVVLMVAMSLGSGSEPDGLGEDLELQMIDAERYCQDEVEARLKAPATAEFGDPAVTGFGPFTVTGTVDSENSFGAMLRSIYSCEVHLAGGSWVLDDFTIDE